jgi:copper chaperone
MEKVVLKVEGMSCAHCVKAVTDAVNALYGIESVEVSLEDKTATVVYDPAMVDIPHLKMQIEDQGYDVIV